MKNQTHRHKQSFTLIELLIVIAIIAILAAVIVANVTSAQAQARDVRRTQDLDQLKTALEMYYFDHNKYPQGSIGGSNSDQGFCIEQNQGFKDLLIDGDYISSLPQDPLYNSSQCSDPSSTNCHCYFYKTDTNQKYKIFVKTEQEDLKPAKQDGGISDIYYEAYSPVQGSNQIVLGWPWYKAGPYLSGIVGAWTFNEGVGTIAYDTSGNNNDCTLKNGPTWVDGKFGKALSFDWVNDYVDCGNDSSLDITDAITIEAWVKPPNLPTHYVGYFGKRNETTDDFYVLQLMNTNTLECRFRNSNGGAWDVSPKPTITPNAWNHIVFLKDGNETRAYVNGVYQGSASVSGTPANTTSYTIGRAMYYFNGLIDEVRIYNRALSAEEIADLYAAGGN